MLRFAILALLVCSPALSQGRGGGAPPNYPAPVEGDYIAKNYTFTTGETLPVTVPR